ncbi:MULTISPECIES: hypothetical protein [unclassified Novosphingobium]|jgi:hypothetical protein|uniref:hypothetical protein n=1 Tax=Novosphingobium sp. ERW19 TaxID=2726186 RepID=UPI001F07802C|nr:MULTISPECIES: hypothetical protein [unclassified Novosphingobium]
MQIAPPIVIQRAPQGIGHLDITGQTNLDHLEPPTIACDQPIANSQLIRVAPFFGSIQPGMIISGLELSRLAVGSAENHIVGWLRFGPQDVEHRLGHNLTGFHIIGEEHVACGKSLDCD